VHLIEYVRVPNEVTREAMYEVLLSPDCPLTAVRFGDLPWMTREYQEFAKTMRGEGAKVVKPAGEALSMQPHVGASEARATLGVTGEQQSMHGLPRSVGKHVPGYDPDAALTVLGDRALHTELDRPWKNAFQEMRRQDRTMARRRLAIRSSCCSLTGSPSWLETRSVIPEGAGTVKSLRRRSLGVPAFPS